MIYWLRSVFVAEANPDWARKVGYGIVQNPIETSTIVLLEAPLVSIDDGNQRPGR